LDVSKDSHAVAIAEAGREGEVRSFGEIGSDAASVRRLVRKLEHPGVRLRFCYEAGPTGYGLKRQIEALGHDCAVIAPSLIPRRPGERVKTNRRDAVRLARLFRAGEMTEIWTPDEAHEAMPDLVRAREAAVKERTRRRSGRSCCGTAGSIPARRPGGRNTSLALNNAQAPDFSG
jgi:transposase